ncbi:MAG: cell wall anchor protein [Byssovorax sp.]
MSSAIFSTTARILVSLSLLGWAGCAAVDPGDTGLEGDGESTVGVADQALSTVTYRSSSTASAKSVTSLTITRPAGVVAGDVLLARIAHRNNVTATITPPAGWTVIRSDQSASAIKTWVLWKVATGAEPASYAFDFSIAAYVAGSIVAFSGADPVNPIDAASGQKNGDSASLISPAITTTAANGVAVWFGTQVWTGAACPASPIVPPSGFTEPFDTCLVSSSTGVLFDAAYMSLGAAGLQTAFNGSSPFPNTNTAQVVALRPAGAPSCTSGDTYAGTYTNVGNLTSTDIVEVSGLAASRVNPGVLYAHSENNANFVAIDKTTAAIVGNYVAGVFPWDWEDVATGPCPAGKCIFMGDIGQASGHPPPVPTIFAVYRMKEPNIAAGETSGTISGQRFPFQYPDGAKNAEALMVHPTTGDIYVVTKNGTTGLSKAYKFPNPLPAPDTLSTLIHVADLQMPLGVDGNFRSVTAGTIHPCANRFLLRTYRAVYEYRAPAGGAFETAFAASPVALTDTVEGQGESVEYEADGSGYFTMSEKASSPYTLRRVARQ